MRFGLTIAALTLTAAEMIMMAAPPLSTIRDTIYKADGTRFTGRVTIEWRSFEASDTSFIGRQRVETEVVDGALSVRLVPTTNANSTAWYKVNYASGGNVQFTEAWAVKPSTTPLRVRDVRVADPLSGPGLAGGLTEIEISDVTGLQTELDLRPKKAPVYTTSRAVMINGDGDLEAVPGDVDECVKVDGTSGPCGGGAGSLAVGTFVDGENPSGVVDGSNTTFTLEATPNPASSVQMYRNGVLQKRGLDYNLTGNAIQFVTGAAPQPGDVLVASYRTAGSGGTLPVVLCTGVGTSTNQTAPTSLGTCTIAAATLKNGDRIEIRWDVSHDGGTGTGFQCQVLWGASVIASKTAGAGVTAATGRTSGGVNALGTQWSTLAWGNGGLALSADAGNAVDSVAGALTVDFRGQMSGATAETVTLRGFTVVRNPAP